MRGIVFHTYPRKRQAINRIVGFAWNDGGTNVEDELPTPASSPTWRPTSAPVFPGPISASSCNSCMASDDCFPDGGK